MALNLWTSGGKPSSYNPLPLSTVNNIIIGIGDYTVKFKAKSPTGAKLWVYDAGLTDIDQRPDLTTDFKEYIYNFTSKESQLFYIRDYNSTGDIIIQDIELVEKPLGKATINGIDGFNSGKWELHANATVIDDETVELNVNDVTQMALLVIPVIGDRDYSYSLGESNGHVRIQCVNENGTEISRPYNYVTQNSGSFKTPAGTKSIWFSIGNYTQTTGKFTFKRPMLNLGSIPAPYEKKRGDRMVMPVAKKNMVNIDRFEIGTVGTANDNVNDSTRLRTIDSVPLKKNTNYTISIKDGFMFYYRAFNDSDIQENHSGVWQTNPQTFDSVNATKLRLIVKRDIDGAVFPYDAYDMLPQLEEGTTATPYEPYAVQINNKRKVSVPKKNLFDKESVSYSSSIGANGSVTPEVGKGVVSSFIGVKPNTIYYRSHVETSFDTTSFYDANKSFISRIFSSQQFTVPSNAYYVRVKLSSDWLNTFQIEEGTTATPYEPYQLVTPKAPSGLVMDGASNYVQLPSMTMDAIEVDCLIDSVQPETHSKIVDARTGLSGGGVLYRDNLGFTNSGGWSSFTGAKYGERTTIKLTAPQSFTDDVTIFALYSTGADNTKGIIYGIKCYLNGQVVASYDFTNPNNMVGDKVLNGTAKNLLPSFDSGKWAINANARVLGKDVMRLDTVGANQYSSLIIPVIPNKSYLLVANFSQGSRFRFAKNTGGMGSGLTTISNSTNGYNYTVPSDISELLITFDNTTPTGSFDFIKPQLYELDGKEGTIFGTPQALLQSSKRTLFAKR